MALGSSMTRLIWDDIDCVQRAERESCKISVLGGARWGGGGLPWGRAIAYARAGDTPAQSREEIQFSTSTKSHYTS